MQRRGWALVALAVGLCCAASTAVGAPTPTSVHFTAAGDYGTSTDITGEVIKTVAAAKPDLHLALGDLSYGVTGQEQAWCDLVKQRVGEGFPFELITGNHESDGLNGNINDFSACLPNQLPGAVGTYGRQYYVDVPQEDPLVRYVMIAPGIRFADGLHTYAAGTADYAWTAAAIDGARADGVPWVVVGMHKPCLSSGGYACDPGPDLTNLLLSKKVDLVLMGHEHSYQRTKQLALGPGCTSLAIGSYDADCVRDSDNALTAGAGTVFMTIGTGGISQRDINVDDAEHPYFAASAGLNMNRTYGVSDFQVTPDKIDVSFRRAAAATGSGTFTDAFTITRGATGPNTPPVAAFTETTNGLSATFDSTASGDIDGAISAYAWSFGDGGGSTLANPSHTFPSAGTYTVQLTVTDDDGATTSTSHAVTVAANPGPQVLAADTFTRVVTGGWGAADTGGGWTADGPVSRFSVSGGTGRLLLASSQTLSARLQAVSTTRSLVTAEFSTDKIAEGLYVSLVGRQVGSDQYVARLRTQADGQARLYLLQNQNAVANLLIPGLTIQPDVRYKMAFQVVGTNPTQLAAKVWRASAAEPADWQRTGSNSFAALQGPGHVGVLDYLPGSASAQAPVTLSWDDVRVVQPAP